MHPLSSTTNVTYEAEGGIRNPACQDDEDLSENKASARQSLQSQQQWPAGAEEGGKHDSLTAAAKKNGESCRIHEKSQDFKEAMTICHTRVPWRFSFNYVLAITVSLVIILGEFGVIPNQQLGFYCNDARISHKFTGDTISAVTLIIVTVTVPAIVIWLTEWSCYSSDSYKCLDSASSSRSRQFWIWYGYYTLGWWYMTFIVEIIKCIVGEPRPHFIDSCKPNDIVNCTNEYRSTYTCTNTELSSMIVNDSDKSFPSGHSALSMFLTVYLVWYIQVRMSERLVLMLVKPWLQCLCILWGLGCCMSRITDHRHHWWDVVVGAVLGISFAFFVVRVPCRSFRSGSTLLLAAEGGSSRLDTLQPGAAAGTPGSGYAASSKRHQSVKKLLNQSSIEAPEDRELGDMPGTWSA